MAMGQFYAHGILISNDTSNISLSETGSSGHMDLIGNTVVRLGANTDTGRDSDHWRDNSERQSRPSGRFRALAGQVKAAQAPPIGRRALMCPQLSAISSFQARLSEPFRMDV